MQREITIRRAYDDMGKSTVDTGKGLTEQAHKSECDMNYILREYTKTGLIKHAKNNEGRYDDVTGIDFQTAMDTVVNVQNLFNDLPGQIRKRFNNDPEGFLDFCHDENNREEMQKMGILRGNDGFDIKGAIVDSPTPEKTPTE